MPMFVRLDGYLDVLAFPPKFVNADFKAGIFSDKNQNTPSYLNLCL